MNQLPYQEQREKPWGHEIIYTPPTLGRTGKVLFVRAGCKLSLQYHDQKEETIMLFSGQALLWLQDTSGVVEKVPMEVQKGYTIYPMQIHRIEAVADAYLLEVSSPEAGTTVRVEDDYERPDEKR